MKHAEIIIMIVIEMSSVCHELICVTILIKTIIDIINSHTS